MDADIAKGNLSAQNMTIVISGQTSDGKDTQIDITINANVSDIGSTTPQMIDTSSLQKSSSDLRFLPVPPPGSDILSYPIPHVKKYALHQSMARSEAV